MSDLGETSLCRLRGEGVRLRLLLTSPFLAPGPDVGLLGPSSSEDDDPVSETKKAAHQQLVFPPPRRVLALNCRRRGRNTKVGIKTQLQ